MSNATPPGSSPSTDGIDDPEQQLPTLTLYPDDPVRATHVEIIHEQRTEKYMRVRRSEEPAATGPRVDAAFKDPEAVQQAVRRLSNEELQERIARAQAHRRGEDPDDDEDTSDDDKWESVLIPEIATLPGDTLRTKRHVIDRQLAPLYRARTVEEVAAAIEQANKVSLDEELRSGGAC